VAEATNDTDDPKVAKLIALARMGDRHAWAAVVGLYAEDIWKMSLRLLHGDRPAADDLFQRTWEKAQIGLVTFRGEVPLLIWIRRICRNCQADDWRRQQRQNNATQASLDADSAANQVSTRSASSPVEDQRIACLDVRRALSALDEDEREAFLLVKGAGYTSTEVAQIRGVPPSTVRSQLARARGKLAALLREYQCRTS
jgi:RNA polymerase sigma-70 factor, ECF subfamily